MRKKANIEPFKKYFAEGMRVMMQHSQSTVIDKKNVYRKGNPTTRYILESFINKVLLPESCIIGFENLHTLYKLATEQKKSTLILMEHYSNIDFPALMYLLSKYGHRGSQIEQSIVPLATIRLNEDHPLLSAFTDSYTHISIFPARRLEQISISRSQDAELRKAREINHAAMHVLHNLRQNGKIILMFPSGTRYKPGFPDTKRVLKVVDSVIKRFDYIICAGIMGTVLAINDPNNTLNDYVRNDIMVYSFGKPIKVKSFRATHKMATKQSRSEHKSLNEESAPKRDEIAIRVAEQIEQELDELHTSAESLYNTLIEEYDLG